MNVKLPMPCVKCEPFEGGWMESPNGLVRCDCPRGAALAAVKKAVRQPQPPVISPQSATLFAEMMAAIPNWYPREESARGLIADEISSMCGSDREAIWLVRQMCRLYRNWPGIQEMRIVLCAGGYVPLDGIEPVGDSEVYPEGIPLADAPTRRDVLEPQRDPRSRELPPGEGGRLIRTIMAAKRGVL